MRDDAAIRLCELTKRYIRPAETITAVSNVTLGLDPGTITVISGPSGSGKTTLLNLIVGWERPDEGHIEGLPPSPRWRDLAVIPQALGLLDHLTIAENVALPRRIDQASLPTEDVMEALGIAHLADRFPPETSLGEQQRTACARALVAGARLLIADEPTSHQDDDNTHLIIERLSAAAEDGSTVLVATHDERITARASRALAIRDGVVTDA